MCGRYAITLPPEAMRAVFGFIEQPNFPPRFNVAPTQPVPIVRADPGDSILAATRRRREGMPETDAIAPEQAISEAEAWACFGR